MAYPTILTKPQEFDKAAFLSVYDFIKDEEQVSERQVYGCTFDGCHKIWVYFDEDALKQVAASGSYDYVLISKDAEEVAHMAAHWYEDSCPLRFICAVWVDWYGETQYKDIVPQCE